jgi:hypothetical protein
LDVLADNADNKVLLVQGILGLGGRPVGPVAGRPLVPFSGRPVGFG